MKKKQAIKAILSTLSECWFTKREKKVNFLPHSVQSFDGLTHIFVCPIRHEIVGGPKDGKTGYFSFLFGINKFTKACKSKGIIVKDIVLLSRGKNQFECPAIAFEIKNGRSNMLLHLFTAPVKAMTMSMKIKSKNHGKV
jgi:hypothetical protein